VAESCRSGAEDRPLAQVPGEQLLAVQRAMLDAEQAAWNTRRILDASGMGLYWGSCAGLMCSLAALCVLDTESWASPLGYPVAFLSVLLFSVAGVAILVAGRRLRGSSGACVTDRQQASTAALCRRPLWLGLFLGLAVAALLLGSAALRALPYGGVQLAVLLIVAAAVGAFLARFARFRFWEDLLFAALIATAWGLYMTQSRLSGVAPLALATPPAALLGMGSLYRRWRRVARSLSADHAETDAMEIDR